MQRKITHRIDGEHATRGYFYNNESDNLISVSIR